jgi:hypothetical protein
MLMQRTQDLGPTEHEEIFKILNMSGIDHTQNNNGVFINLSRVPDDVVDRVQNFVDFCFDNKHDLDEYDKRLNECKLSNNYDRIRGTKPDTEDDAGTDEPKASPVQFAPAPALPPPSDTLTSVAKRIMNSKFHQAKKKYAKKRVVDRKNDDMSSHDLLPEPYLIA